MQKSEIKNEIMGYRTLQSSGKEYDSERYKQADTVTENQVKAKKQQPKNTSLLQNMEKMEQKRQERREKMNQMKQQKQEKEQLNKESNRNVDVDFEDLINQERLNFSLQHVPVSNNRLSVIVRKRPLFAKEEEEGELDSISCSNPIIRVHEPKLKVDGITKYIENHDFQFDNAFSEKETTEDVYRYSLQPLIKCIFDDGVITCFAYGQTGSGKTFTMKGLQQHYINDIFSVISSNHQLSLSMSFYEIYGGKCYDLLNERNLLNILEDKHIEKTVRDQLEMIEIIEQAAVIRTTHATEANEESSRSHAICQIIVKENNVHVKGKLILVDLAGSERAQDCQSNSKQRRIEGADIGKSLLALKECIRAMESGAQHVPFRGSKLTLVLREQFLSKSQNSHIVMLACISPGSSSSDHSVNTLRYADRLKESNGVKQNIIKIIEDQSKNQRKQFNSQSLQNIMKKQELDESDSNKKIPPTQKKILGQKIEQNQEKQYDHTQYLQDNNKNKENLKSVENIPLIANDHKQNLLEKNVKQQNKPSTIQKIPPIQQNQVLNTVQNPKSTTNQSNQQNSLPLQSIQQQRERREDKGEKEERPQTQQKRQNSIGKKSVNQNEQKNQNTNKLLQQKSLNTDVNNCTDLNSLQNSQQNKPFNQKQQKQVVQSAAVTSIQQLQQQQVQQLQQSLQSEQIQQHKQQQQSQQQLQQHKQQPQNQQHRINSAHPVNLQQNNNSKEEVNNSNQFLGKKIDNKPQKKINQNQDNISTINNKHTRDASQNSKQQQNPVNAENNLNEHVLQKNKEVQENIEKAYQHQQEQKTKDNIIQQLKEKQEEIFSAHVLAIKEDANLLSLESGILTDIQREGFMDCDIDNYVKKFESIVSKKLHMYNLLSQKMENLKKMRSDYTSKYSSVTNSNEKKQNPSTNLNKQVEEQGKKKSSFLLKKKTDHI